MPIFGIMYTFRFHRAVVDNWRENRGIRENAGFISGHIRSLFHHWSNLVGHNERAILQKRVICAYGWKGEMVAGDHFLSSLRLCGTRIGHITGTRQRIMAKRFTVWSAAGYDIVWNLWLYQPGKHTWLAIKSNVRRYNLGNRAIGLCFDDRVFHRYSHRIKRLLNDRIFRQVIWLVGFTWDINHFSLKMYWCKLD